VRSRSSARRHAQRRSLFAVALAMLLSCLSSRAHAQQATSVEWQQEWPRFRGIEIGVTAALALETGAALFLYPDPKANWHGGILFDDPVRNLLRLRTRGARETANQVSDVLYFTLATYPLVVDAGIVAGAVHGSGDVALQLMAMDLESYAFSGAIALSLEHIGRVRPEERGCRGDPNYSKDCGNPAQLNASFLSGHTTIAFTGAGLMCAHHQHLPLYGGGAPDLIACVTALSAATGAGASRIMADKHYATDVLLGMGVGLFGGYGLPMLLHYGATSGRSRPSALLPTFQSRELGMTAVLAPAFDVTGAGLTLTGIF